jgi:hypothetical protein
MKVLPNKFVEELPVIAHDAGQFVQDAYGRVMVKSLIMSASTGQVHWTMYQLVWSVAARIGGDNLQSGVNSVVRFTTHLLPH